MLSRWTFVIASDKNLSSVREWQVLSFDMTSLILPVPSSFLYIYNKINIQCTKYFPPIGRSLWGTYLEKNCPCSNGALFPPQRWFCEFSQIGPRVPGWVRGGGGQSLFGINDYGSSLTRSSYIFLDETLTSGSALNHPVFQSGCLEYGVPPHLLIDDQLRYYHHHHHHEMRSSTFLFAENAAASSAFSHWSQRCFDTALFHWS